MRRSEKQVTEFSKIEEILRSGRICQLVLIDEPLPYIVTLNYGYHDGALYFHSAQEGRKLELIARNPQASFCIAIDHGLIKTPVACHSTTRFQSVVGEGTISFLESEEEKREGLRRIMQHYGSPDFNFKEMAVDKTRVYRLQIERMTAKQSRMPEG